MGFQILDEVTRADYAFQITGKDLNELFISGVEALLSVMITDISNVLPTVKRKVHLTNSKIDLLLYDFLQEMIFYKDSESLLLIPRSVNIKQKKEKYVLECDLAGEKIDRKKHKIVVDVKAVTMHKLNVVEIKNGWSAEFVLDV